MMRKIFCVLAMILVSVTIHAQSIKGKITANNADQPVAAATVHLLNTGITVLANNEGVFNIENLAPGSYNIEVTAVGYATAAKQVDVNDKQTTTVDFTLQNVLTRLDAVVVTAEKKEGLLQNTPISITAIGSRQAEAMRLWNSKEISGYVPNLSAGNSGDGRNVVSIRGITTTSYDPAVTTYIDGVNQFSLDTYIPQLLDIERIEVLRGPQGTLYGRNAMGGVINIITKQPTNPMGGSLEVSMGDYNQKRISSAFYFAPTGFKFSAGASVVFDNRNGYYENDYNNTSFDKQKNMIGNGFIKYKASKNLTITFNIKQQTSENNGAFPMVFGIEDAFKNPFKLNQNATAQMKDETTNLSLSVQHTGSKVNFSSLLAYQGNHRYYTAPLDGDFSPYDAVTVINNYDGKWNKVKVLTHEFRFSSIQNKKLTWTAGTYFFHQTNPNKQATHFGKDTTGYGVFDTDFSIINITEAKNTGVAAYGQIQYNFTTKLALIAGARYDYENKELSVRGEYQKDGTEPFVILPDTAGKKHYSAFSPKLGLQYQATSNTTWFANYSRGFRTGGLTQLSADPSLPPLYPYNPEYSNNIEVGIKNSLLENRLSVNVTLFITHVTDAQVPTLVLPDAIIVTRNTGKLVSKGAEVELLFKLAKGLQLEYNAGFTNAKYQTLKVPGDGGEVNLEGKKQIFTPASTSMFAAQYGFDISRQHEIRWFTRAEWFRLGKQYFDLANTIEQKGYDIVNARTGISVHQFDLFFWTRNLFNKKYIEYAYDFGAVHLGNPATYGVTAKIRF